MFGLRVLAISLVLHTLASGSPLAHAMTSFTDVGAAKGLTHTGTTYGASWVPDMNGDGRPDVWMGNHSNPNPPILYASTPAGGFAPSTALNGVNNSDNHGAAWGDFNSDGNPDLLVIVGGGGGSGQGANQLLVHNGSQLVEQAAAYNIDYPFGRGRHATWVDWNNDGFLDVIITNRNNRSVAPDAFSRIFTYNPATTAFIEEPFTIHDEDNQPFAQLLFSNPSLGGIVPAFLTHVRKNSGGEDTSFSYLPSGLTDVSATFGFPPLSYVNDAIPGDFDNDGTQDMVFAALSGITYLEQRASGFVNKTSGSGLTTSQGAFITAADFNNDMRLDLYVARANPGQDTNLPNVYYENQGNGTFTAISQAGGAAGTSSGYVSSATSVDYNNDGRMDILLTNTDDWWAPSSSTNGAPIQLFENTTSNGNKWLKIQLAGVTSNAAGIGAVVELTAGGVTQMRENNGGIHHRSQDDSRLHFGLAGNAQADTITVTWPSGTVQQLTSVAANQIITITEGGGGGGNSAPTAQFTMQPGTAEREIDFNASTSFDSDGSIVSWAWDFGDSNSGSGATTSHTYASDGSYQVTLTVTDDQGATDDASLQVVIDSSGGTLTQAPFSVHAVGAKNGKKDRMRDTDLGGAQDLTTYWNNNNVLATAWATIDLGSSLSLAQVRLATRHNKQHDLQLTIGDNLSGNQVSGGEVRNCDKPALGSGAQPSALYVCTIGPNATGRYLTIRSTNRVSIRIYGLEVWVGATGGGGNSPPTAAFTATSTLLATDFDGSTSSDNDGTVVAWDWNFGDSSSDIGEFTDHTYAAAGTYTVTLTVTDAGGAMDVTSQQVTVSDGGGSGPLAVTLEAVGAKAGLQDNLLDVDGAGAQDLSTFWRNNGDSNTAWFTVNLGSAAAVTSIRIAPKATQLAPLNFYVGATLVNGRISGTPDDSCVVPITGSVAQPSALYECIVTLPAGTFITVEATSPPTIRIYGAEFWM